MNIFPIERTQDDDMTGVNTITKKALHHFSGHRVISMQEGVHMVDDQELVICSDSMTYVSITQGQVLRDDTVQRKGPVSAFDHRSGGYKVRTTTTRITLRCYKPSKNNWRHDTRCSTSKE